MRGKHFLFGVVTGVILTLLGGAIVLAFIVTRPAPAPLEPSPVASGDLVVSISEAYLSTLATDWGHSEEESIQSVAVDVQTDGRLDMIATARFQVLGRSVGVQVRLRGSLAVEEQGLRFALLNISFVGLSVPLDVLPGSLRSMIENLESDFNQDLNSALFESGFVPVGVRTDLSSVEVALKAR
jgi:hypothetical protein